MSWAKGKEKKMWTQADSSREEISPHTEVLAMKQGKARGPSMKLELLEFTDSGDPGKVLIFHSTCAHDLQLLHKHKSSQSQSNQNRLDQKCI